MSAKQKFTRKIQPRAPIPEGSNMQRSADRRLYMVELLKAARLLGTIVGSMDTFSMSIIGQAERLEAFKCDADPLVELANTLQDVGLEIQREADRLEKKSKFPPQ